MKRADCEILCCPRCHGDLVLVAKTEERNEIVEGQLDCKACTLSYQIQKGVASLVPPGHKVEAGYGGYDEWP